MDRIVAILPTEIKGIGIGCEVYTEKKVFVDKRTCCLFLKHMAEKSIFLLRLCIKILRKFLRFVEI